MVNYNQIDLREPNHLDFFDKDIGETLQGLKIKNYNPWIWEFIIQQEAPDAVAEIYVDFTVDFDNGEATPIVLYIIGEAANEDKAAGTGAQIVTIYGFGVDGIPQLEAVTMHGTANTQIASIKLWSRFVGAQVTTAGAGGTNAGIIQITNTGQAEVYGTIAAGENATIGARVFVPANYNAFIGSLKGMSQVLSDAAAEVVYGVGVIISPFYLRSTITDLMPTQYWVNPNNGMHDINIPREIVVGANTLYITFKHQTKADDANDVGVYHIRIIMYGTTNALRGGGLF